MVWLIIGFSLGYFAIEFIISTFFNLKIKNISKENYLPAAFHGMAATFLYVGAIGMSSLVGIYFSFWWLPLMSAASMAIGNFVATLMTPYTEKVINNLVKKIKPKVKK